MAPVSTTPTVGQDQTVLECVLNLSEGRRSAVVADLAATAGDELLDLHSDPDHNRSVLTLVGTEAPRAVARAAVERLDLRRHTGVHPRIGVVDVVPFVALAGSSPADARAARDEFAVWIATELGVPAFLYGPERSLPELRRGAFTTLAPDHGPSTPHPRAGAVAVGVRPVLMAWNLWLAEPDLATARSIATAVRSTDVRALGLQVGEAVQVSMNLLAPLRTGPAQVYDRVASMAPVARAELVGLVTAELLESVPSDRWAELDLGPDRTVEARLARR